MILNRITRWVVNGTLAALLLTGGVDVSTAAADSAVSPVWQENFDDGINAADTYYDDGEISRLEATDEGTIRATLPGKRALEGFRLLARGLGGDRLATVTARVRGRGELMMCMRSGNGWIYPGATKLTDQWQTIKVNKPLGRDDDTLNIYFIAPSEVQKDAVYEVDDVQVHLAAPMALSDTAVEPRTLEAERFATNAGEMVDVSDAGGGRVVENKRFLRLMNIPFPRTSRAVTAYLRVQTPTATARFRLRSSRGGSGQTLQSVDVEPGGGWQWVALPAVHAEEVGDTFGISAQPRSGGGEPITIDRLVLSTRDDLNDASLDSAPALLPAGPMAAVKRTHAAPEIDGRADDAAWSDAVMINDFVAYRTYTPLSAATNMAMVYDDEHLYVLFRNDEPMLDVARQQRHQIEADAKERDDSVLRDDSCMLIVQPTDDDAAYEFSVNTIGTLLDARCSDVNDMWGSRDRSWNAEGVRVETEQGDGYWVAELAIPWSAMAVETPEAGTRWQGVVARVAQSREEQGTWNHTGPGAHAPKTKGTLVFVDDAPAIHAETPLRRLVPGHNARAITIAAGEDNSPGSTSGMYLWTQVRPDDQPAESALEHIIPQRAAQSVEHAFDVTQQGSVGATWAVLDAATLKPIYISPAIRMSVRTSHAELTLDTPGPYRVVVNNQTIARGNEADVERIRIPLREGENVLAVQAEHGVAAVDLDLPGEGDYPIRWRMNDAETEGALSSELDDRSWPLAPTDGETLAGVGPRIGTGEQPMVLRHTVLWSKTRVWPLPKPALHVAKNTVQHMTFTALGLEGKRMADWTVHVALPEAFEVLGSTGYYGHSVDIQPLFESEHLGETTIDGETLQLYKIHATKPIRHGRHHMFSKFELMLRVAEDQDVPNDSEWHAYYWTHANDGSMSEPSQRFTLKVLPPIDGEQPERFVFQLWGSGFHVMDNKSLRRPLLQAVQDAGFNEFVASDRWTAETGEEYGLATQKLVNFRGWSLNVAPYLESNPDQRLIDLAGEPNDGYMCMTHLLGDGWSAVEEMLRNEIEETMPAIIQYDYEFSPFTGPHSCFCERCLNAFREYTDPSLSQSLSGEVIQGKHTDEWVDFMAWRVAKMMRQFKDSVHQIKSGTQFSIYSGYQTPENPARYGIDWSYIGELDAADVIGAGYGRPVPAIQTTIDALDGIPALFGVLLRPYNIEDSSPLAPATPARVLRRALDASGGVLVYTHRIIDGRSWLAVADVTRLVAAHEDMFLDGKLETLPGHDPARVQVLRKDEQALLCVMNESDEPAEFSINLPTALGGGASFYSDQQIDAGGTLNLELQGGEIAVYLMQ